MRGLEELHVHINDSFESMISSSFGSTGSAESSSLSLSVCSHTSTYVWSIEVAKFKNKRVVRYNYIKHVP